jgi:hypothetical protein
LDLNRRSQRQQGWAGLTGARSPPIKGKTPAIDLVVGYHKANTSPILKLFLSKLDELIKRVEETAR